MNCRLIELFPIFLYTPPKKGRTFNRECIFQPLIFQGHSCVFRGSWSSPLPKPLWHSNLRLAPRCCGRGDVAAIRGPNTEGYLVSLAVPRWADESLQRVGQKLYTKCAEWDERYMFLPENHKFMVNVGKYSIYGALGIY